MVGRARGLVVVVGLLASCAGAAPPIEPRVASVAPTSVVAPTTIAEADAGPTPTWTPPEGTDPELARLAVEWIDGTGVVADPIGRVGCEIRVRTASGALDTAYGLVVPPCDAPGSRDVIGLDGVSRPFVEGVRERSLASHVRTGIELDAPDRSFATLVLLVRLGAPALALELARARVRYSHAPIETLYADAAMEIAGAHADAAALAFILGDVASVRDHVALARAALDRAPASAEHRVEALRSTLDAIDASLEAPPVGSAADAIARRDPSALGGVLGDLHDADVTALIVWAHDDDASVLPVLIAALGRDALSRARHACADRLLCSVGEIARGIVGDHTADMDPGELHTTTLEMWERWFRGRSDVEGLEAILGDASAGAAAWTRAAQELDQRRDMGDEAGSPALGAALAARVADLLASDASPTELCTLWLSAVHLQRRALAAQTRTLSRSPLALAIDCRDYAFVMRMEDHDRDADAEYAAWLDGHELDPTEAEAIHGIWGAPGSPALHRWIGALVGRAATDALADLWIATALYGGHGLSSREVTDYALAALGDRTVICDESPAGLRCGARDLAARNGTPTGPLRRCDLYATALDHANALTHDRSLFGDVAWSSSAPESERDASAAALARALRAFRGRHGPRD